MRVRADVYYAYNYIVIMIAFAVLRKYYDALLECFSDDHITTISTLCEVIPVSEGFFNKVLSMTYKEANRRILNALLCGLKNDNQLLALCEILETLISQEKRFSKEIFEFEIGKVICMLYHTVR